MHIFQCNATQNIKRVSTCERVYFPNFARAQSRQMVVQCMRADDAFPNGAHDFKMQDEITGRMQVAMLRSRSKCSLPRDADPNAG